MATKARFFDSIAGDRIYTSDAWSEIIYALIGDGYEVVDADAGMSVIANSPAAMNVKVNLGRVFVRGRYFEVYSAQEVVTITAAHATLSRIDRIVVRLSYTARTITLAAKAGTPAASPTAPALQRDTSIWELSLAQVAVGPAVVSIVTGNITDERDNATVCGKALLWPRLAHEFLTNNPHVVTAAQIGVASGAQVNVIEDVQIAGNGVGTGWARGLVAKVITLTINVATGIAHGLMSATDKAKLDAATPALTVGAMVQRDGNGDAYFRFLSASVSMQAPSFIGNAATATLAAAATALQAGQADRIKLDGIQAGAQVNPTRFTSGELSLGSGVNATLAIPHGLGAQPWNVIGYWGTVSGSLNFPMWGNGDLTGAGSGIQVYAADATNVLVINRTGVASPLVKIRAML